MSTLVAVALFFAVVLWLTVLHERYLRHTHQVAKLPTPAMLPVSRATRSRRPCDRDLARMWREIDAIRQREGR